MQAEEILAEHAVMVEQELRRLFEERGHPRRLYEMMMYHLGWLDQNLKPCQQYPGKRVRPTLCLLTYRAISGVYTKALPAAAAIELIHNFSLIHDDIEDKDEKRRGRPTVWKLFGEAHAINAGDGMHVLANLAALRLREYNVTDERVVDVLQVLNSTVMELCEGQYLDMSFEERLDIGIDSYLDMVSRKTAALMEASTHVGALLATRDQGLIDNFRKFGRRIGIAFQIVDDMIGIWGEKTGKPKASDIRKKKKILPVIYAFENASSGDRVKLEEIYAKDKLSENDVKDVLEILEKTRAKDFSMNKAGEYFESALDALKSTEIRNDTIKMIETVSEFLIRRKY